PRRDQGNAVRGLPASGAASSAAGCQGAAHRAVSTARGNFYRRNCRPDARARPLPTLRVSSEVSSLIWPRIVAGPFFSDARWGRWLAWAGDSVITSAGRPGPASSILEHVPRGGERRTDDRPDFGAGTQDEASLEHASRRRIAE